MIDFEKHPLGLVRLILQRVRKPLILEFSRYVYVPQQLFDQRYTFHADANEVSAAWVQELFASLKSNEEIALHSCVKLGRRTFHIPMVDFAVSKWDVRVEGELEKYLPRTIVNSLLIFSSGRSFHGYSPALLSPKEWRQFMGRLLLVNAPNADPITDARWIGHRLYGGFASLRWSWNTGHYQRAPEFLKYADRGQPRLLATL